MKGSICSRLPGGIGSGALCLLAMVAAPSVTSAVTLDKTSNWQPALAVFNGKLFLAYTGTDSQLNVASSTDGLTFGNSVTITNNTSINGPGLAAYAGNLYIAWAGTDGKRRLNYMSSPDGVTWGNKSLFGDERSYSTPALAGSSNQLLIAYTGTDSVHSVNIACIVCVGLNYGTKNTYAGSTAGVGLAAINDNFFLSVRRNGAANVLSSPAANPLTLTQQASVGTSAVGPAIAGSGSFAYVGWIGAGNSLNNATFQVAGTSATLLSQAQTPAGQTSTQNPAIAVFNGHVYYAWTGLDDHINIEMIY